MAKILVVEDNPDNLELMVYLLQAFGHTPLAAHDGEEGFELARRELPELIICDLQMPKLSGFALAKILKQHPALRAIPLIAVTAYAMVGDRDKVLASGFDSYLTKPIEPQLFVQQIEALLHPAQRSAALRAAPPAQAAAQPAAAAHPPEVRATILVVDNTSANLQLMQELLEPSGFRVLLAGGAAEGLAQARAALPDLIISDVHMPELDGFDFIRLVQADPRLKDIPFMFLSSTMRSASDLSTSAALGARRFVLRPIEPQRLLAEIEAILAKA